jgi:hypothetical protein
MSTFSANTVDEAKCTMFENLQVFLHLHLKFGKSAIRNPKNFCVKNINMDIKNAEFLRSIF